MPIGRPVDAVPPVREEGDTTVMSVVEEIVVVEHRLILKEEWASPLGVEGRDRSITQRVQ